MAPWVLLFVVCNVIDTVSTLAVVMLGLGTELNPLMAALLELSPLAFVLAKIAVGGASLAVLHCDGPELGLSGGFFKGLTVVYSALVLWHAINWVWLICYSS
jgi:hypothetical protein